MSMRFDYGAPQRGSAREPDKSRRRSSGTSWWCGLGDGCARIRSAYWNGGHAVAFISFVGLIVCMEQYRFWTLIDRPEVNNRWAIPFMFGFASTVASMSSGVLACIYPAHNTLAFSVALSSVVHLLRLTIADTSSIVFNSFSAINLCQFMAIAMALPAFHGIWTMWMPQSRRSIRHVPIVLYYALYQNSGSYLFDVGTVNDLRYLSYAIGAFGLLWSGVLWVYVVRKTNTRADHSSATQNLLNIPWKAMCCSKPVHAIVVANICEALGYSFDYMFSISSQILQKGRSVNVLTSVSILFVVVLVEFFPKTNCFSTTFVRKFWSCLFFSSRAVFHLLYLSFPHDVARHFDRFVDVYNAIGVLYCFGFVVNHLDVSSRYASLLVGFTETVKHICYLFSAELFHVNLYAQMLHAHEISVLVSIAHIAAAIFYAVYASGESQSWATPDNRMPSSGHRWTNRFV